MQATRDNRLYTCFAYFLGVVSFAAARLNLNTYPLPWNDDAAFFLPAAWFADHGNFRPITLNAPSGDFWLPDGFAVILGTCLRIFGSRIEVAHLLCEILISLSVIWFALSARWITKSLVAAAVACLCLFTPGLLFAANMVRMEAVLIPIVVLAILCHCHGQYLAAGALLFGGILVHPIVGIAAAAYAVAILSNGHLRRTLPRSPWWAWVLGAAVIGAWVLEVVHYLAHSDVSSQHLAFQFARKHSRSVKRFFKLQGLVLYASAALLAYCLQRRKLWSAWWRDGVIAIASASLLLMFSAVLGAELSYNVYSLSLGPAIVVCLLYRALTDRSTAA